MTEVYAQCLRQSSYARHNSVESDSLKSFVGLLKLSERDGDKSQGESQLHHVELPVDEPMKVDAISRETLCWDTGTCCIQACSFIAALPSLQVHDE